jgi:NAD(P)-dependent dehydrogenase (short-subunit alcohol dehydrogenase family)
MTPKLTGTTALVTGASSGIGAATARLLAEHGATVALVARRKDRLADLAAEIDKAGGCALVVEADITERAQAEAAVQRTVERFGRLDTLVNNAGLMLLGPVVGADTEEWQRMLAANVNGLLYTTRVGPRPRGHRRRSRLYGHPTTPRRRRRALDHAHRPGPIVQIATARRYVIQPWTAASWIWA